MEQFIVLIFPVFFLLIAAEFAYGWVKRRNTYRLNGALSSLSLGLISQLVAVLTQLFQIGLYARVFDKVRMGHECALMWAAHQVHHQSQDFNFSTALRQESSVEQLGSRLGHRCGILGLAASVPAGHPLVRQAENMAEASRLAPRRAGAAHARQAVRPGGRPQAPGAYMQGRLSAAICLPSTWPRW